METLLHYESIQCATRSVQAEGACGGSRQETMAAKELRDDSPFSIVMMGKRTMRNGQGVTWGQRNG